MEIPAALDSLPNELFAHITLWLEPADLVPLLKCSRNLYKRVVPILWQHIQFFNPTAQSEFAKCSNINVKYLQMAPTAHCKSKAIAARVPPEYLALDRLAGAVLQGFVSETALQSIQQLTLYTQNRYAYQIGFSEFVHRFLLRQGFLSNLKTVRLINDVSGVIQGLNKHFFDDKRSLAMIADAVDMWVMGKANNVPEEQAEVKLFARNSELAHRMTTKNTTALSITFLHMEFIESVDELAKLSELLRKTLNLEVFSLAPSKLRPQFAQRRRMGQEGLIEACEELTCTVNELRHLRSLSLVSGMLIQCMDFNQLPSTLQNLELNKQITTPRQHLGLVNQVQNNCGPAAEMKDWRYFLTSISYPISLESLRLSHLMTDAEEAIPLPLNSVQFDLTNINFIGLSMPPGSDVEIFKANCHLQVVTINTISQHGLRLLTSNCSETLRELTIAKPTGELLSHSSDAFTNDELRLLGRCKKLEYLYVHVFEHTLTGECLQEILEGAKFLTSIFIEYTVPGHMPYITDDEIAQYRWFPGLPQEILLPRQEEYDRIRQTFKPGPGDTTNLSSFLSIVRVITDPINDDVPYVFRDFRIKPTEFGTGCIFQLDLPRFKERFGISGRQAHAN